MSSTAHFPRRSPASRRRARRERSALDIPPRRLLSAERERELARRIERGDLAAKQELVEANLRLVVFVANGFAGRGVAHMDLVQEGSLGLIRAVEKFDHRRGVRFSTYAMWWIRVAMQRAGARAAASAELSLDEHDVLRDRLADDGPPAFELAWRALRREALRRSVAALPAGEREVIALRFGLCTDRPSTRAETAHALGVAPERIRQIELHALKKLEVLAA